MRLPSGSKFGVLSFLCVMALALSMGFALSSLLTRAVEDWEWENTAALARREVELSGGDALFLAPQGARMDERLGGRFSRLAVGLPEVVRVKVWDRQGAILWSDEPRLVGQRFPDNRELEKALAGQVAVEIQALDGQEHAYERGRFTTLTEVYVPIFSKTTGEVVGVVEVYKNPVRLFATIWRGRIVIWTISFAGALILYLLLIPLVGQVYGRQVREEALQAHTVRLEQQVTERTRELQAQREALFQAEKVAAMGQLLAGVAHELSNPLSTIVGYTQLLLLRVGRGPVAERLDKIAKSAERCTRIVRSFLALTRQYPPERQLVSVEQLVEEAMELLAYPFRLDGIETFRSVATDLPQISADPHQLQQVVLNLLTNAHQAVRDTPPPRRLTVTTRYEPTAHRVVLEVADSGPGVPPEIRARIFEPFFTTKRPGQGTGLGLSLSRGIIESHGGTLRLETTRGDGATFVVELPVGTPPAAVEEPRAVEARRPTPGRAVLVVDDEPDVAHVLAEALRLDGHRVEIVNSGMSALALLRERSYDVVLSDIRMPGLGGAELYRELARRQPGLERRLVFITGDTMNPTTKRFLEQTGALSVSKPFDIEEIRRLVPLLSTREHAAEERVSTAC